MVTNMDIQTLDSLCHPRMFHMLNDESIELKHRLKLCRLMWTSNHAYPGKFQLLLNWICSQRIGNKDSLFPLKSYREALGDFLSSKCLADEMMRLPRRINFSHSFIQALVDETKSATKIEDLVYVQKISQTLIFTEGMTSQLDTQFEVFAQFVSAWIGSMHKVIADSRHAEEADLVHEDGKIPSVIIGFTESLLRYSQKNYLKKCIKTKSIITFCHYMFRPLLEFFCAISTTEHVIEHDIAISSLLEQVKQTISCALFSSANSSIYQRLDNDEKPHKTSSKRNKNDPDCFDAIITSLIPADKGEISASHVGQFYRMFLESYEKHVGLKIGMLQELTKRMATRDGCHADESKYSSLNLTVLCELLHITQQYQLYQPTVSTEKSEQLLLYLKELAVSIFYHFKSESSWFQCVETLSKVESSIVEPHFQDLLSALSANEIWASSKSSCQAKGLMASITNHHVKVRQLVKFVETSLHAFDGIVTESVKPDQSIGLSKCIETLGDCIGSQFTKGVSPGVIIGTWTTIVNHLSAKVSSVQDRELDSERESSVIILHLSSKLLRKIVQYTPVLTIWKNIMVRGRLEQCLESLLLLCAPLHDIACTVTGLSQQMRDLSMQAYLITLTSSLRAKDTLQRYAAAEFKSISPALPSILYGGNPKDSLQTPAVFDIKMYELGSSDSKLLFVHLLLHSIKVLSSNISALDICNKSNAPIGSESSRSHEVWHQCLQDCTAKLNSALALIREDSTGEGTVVNGLESDLFILVGDYFPCIEDNEAVLHWLTDVIPPIMSSKDGELHARLKMKLNQVLEYVRSLPNCKLASFLLSSECDKFVVSMTSFGLPRVGMHNTDDLAPLLRKIKKSVKSFQRLDAKSVLEAVGRVANLLQHLDLKRYPRDVHDKFVVVLFSCTALCTQILHHSCQVISKTKCYLEVCIRHFLFFTIDRTVLMLGFDAEMSLPIFGEVMQWVGPSTKHLVKTFLFETIHQSYGDNPKKTFRVLLKRYQQANGELSMPCLTMISIHMLALVEALLITDTNTMTMSGGGHCRKRSLRTGVHMCKKLKLDPDADVEDSQEMMRSHLSQLIAIVCSSPSNKIAERVEFYDVLFASFESFAALKTLDSQLADENASMFFKSSSSRVFEKLACEVNPDTIESMLKCMLCCIYADDVHLAICNDEHLAVLVQLFRRLADVPEKTRSLNRCISGVLERLPEKDFSVCLGGVLQRLGSSGCEDVEVYLHFSHTVVTVVLLEYGLEHPDMRAFCRQFVKSLIDAHVQLIARVDVPSIVIEKRLLLLAVRNLADILKLTWVKLQTPQVCGLLCVLRGVSLSTIVDGIDCKKDALDFLTLFECYCKVVHGILARFDNVRDIVPMINAALWHILQSILKLAQRSAVGTSAVKNPGSSGYMKYTATDELLKCARLIEKLFQLIADNHKQAFSKCVSYVVSNFICTLSSSACVPIVRKALVGAVYFLLSIMDQYCVAMVRNALPVGARDSFQSMYVNYCKYFKYTGRV